jgi:hypothetical protein
MRPSGIFAYKKPDIGGEARQRSYGCAVRREISAAAHLREAAVWSVSISVLLTCPNKRQETSC